jgi:hypothetical protein
MEMSKTKTAKNRDKMSSVQTWSRRKAVSPDVLFIEEKKRTQTWIHWDRWNKVIFLLDVAQMDILTVRQLHNDMANAQVVAQGKLTELQAEIEGKSSFMIAGITELRGRIYRQKSLLARIGRFCAEAKLIVAEHNRKNPQATVPLRSANVSKLPSRSKDELNHEDWMEKKWNIRKTAAAWSKLRELLGTDFDQCERQINLLAAESAMADARQEGIPDQSIETWHLIKLRGAAIEQQRKVQARRDSGLSPDDSLRAQRSR